MKKQSLGSILGGILMGAGITRFLEFRGQLWVDGFITLLAVLTFVVCGLEYYRSGRPLRPVVIAFSVTLVLSFVALLVFVKLHN